MLALLLKLGNKISPGFYKQLNHSLIGVLAQNLGLIEAELANYVEELPVKVGFKFIVVIELAGVKNFGFTKNIGFGRLGRFRR